ncbi:MAG: hypothetical protein GY796_13665 [Chloroflexi bacterium]|nr:hypothetical protein [Chloroflexota bacterium]
MQTNIGPNLTHYQNSSEFMQDWLRDPAQIRPETLMPNLELTDDEIATLIIFINSEPEGWCGKV